MGLSCSSRVLLWGVSITKEMQFALMHKRLSWGDLEAFKSLRQEMELCGKSKAEQILWFDQNVPLYEVEGHVAQYASANILQNLLHEQYFKLWVSAWKMWFQRRRETILEPPSTSTIARAPELSTPETSINKTHLSLRKTSTQCLSIWGDRKHRDNNSQKLKPTRTLSLSPENPQQQHSLSIHFMNSGQRSGAFAAGDWRIFAGACMGNDVCRTSWPDILWGQAGMMFLNKVQSLKPCYLQPRSSLMVHILSCCLPHALPRRNPTPVLSESGVLLDIYIYMLWSY